MKNAAAILPLVGIALVFWLILIRPAQRRQRSLARLQSQVSVGDRVMLTSGIYGTVRGLDDQSVSLEVSEGVILKVVRAAVGSVEKSPARDADEDAELVVDEPEEKQ